MSQPESQTAPEWLEPYEGNDMAGYIMEKGFILPRQHEGSIKSVTNVRDTAIIVTEFAVYRAKPAYQVGFSIELVAGL